MDNMENSKRISRRDAIKTITTGALALSLGLNPKEAEARKPRSKPNQVDTPGQDLPSGICPKHFKGTPGRIREDGKIFTRTQGHNYKSRDGGIMLVDGADYVLSLDIMERQENWEQEIKKAQETGRIMLPAIGPRDKYSLKDLANVLGSRWEFLKPEHQRKTQRAWARKPKQEQRLIYETYQHGAFFGLNNNHNNLTEEQKQGFTEFNNAYETLMGNLTHEKGSAPLYMFKTRDGSVTRGYQNTLPWICLETPTVDDRLLIFQHEMNKHQGKRFNRNNIKKYAHWGKDM